MKKLLPLLIMALILFSCSKEDDSEPEVKNTTFQIVSNVEKQETEIEYLDGTMYEIVVFKFIGDDLAGENTIDPVAPGEESIKTIISEDIEKIKVSFKFLPKESSAYSTADRKYFASYTFITKASENKVTLTSSTMISSSLRASDQSTKESFSNKFK